MPDKKGIVSELYDDYPCRVLTMYTHCDILLIVNSIFMLVAIIGQTVNVCWVRKASRDAQISKPSIVNETDPLL